MYENIIKVTAEINSLKESVDKQIHNYHVSAVSVQGAWSNLQDEFQKLQTNLNVKFDSEESVSSVRNTPVERGGRDRSLNIVISGIPENKNISVWRENVDDVINFIVGRNDEIEGTFRLCRY